MRWIDFLLFLLGLQPPEEPKPGLVRFGFCGECGPVILDQHGVCPRCGGTGTRILGVAQC